MMSLTAGTDPFFKKNRHDADKTMVSLYLNDIKSTQESNHQLFQALHALFPEKDSLDGYRMWYRDSVIQKIRERSWKYEGVPGTCIDIVNVINATSVHWAADRMVIFPFVTIYFRIKI